MNTMLLKGAAGARRKRRGLTLVESAMVLALLGLVIAGALLLYQNASTNNRVSEASSQMAAVAQAVRSVYAGQSNYTGLGNDTIKRALPSKMDGGTGILRHAFNNDLTVAAAGGGGGFTITMDGLPEEGCIALATKDFGRAVQNITAGTGSSSDGTPLTPSEAMTACVGNNQTIVWTLY